MLTAFFLKEEKEFTHKKNYRYILDEFQITFPVISTIRKLLLRGYGKQKLLRILKCYVVN